MDTGNRVLWIVIGVVLLVGGALVVAASAGWLPGFETGSPLLWNEVIELWQDWEPWVWAAVAVLGALVAWLGLVLIGTQLRRSGGHLMSDLSIESPDGRGRTVVGRSTLTQATKHDLEHIRGVDGAAVRLLRENDGTDVRARLDLRDDVSLSALAAEVSEALGRLTKTSGLGFESVDVTVRTDGGAARRVS